MAAWFINRKCTVPQSLPTVACWTCGHIVLESSASFVLAHGGKRWYCSDHRQPYDEYVYCPDSFVGCSDWYYRRMRVDKLGVPIGYVGAVGAKRK